jgi:hypothetical protein
MPSLGFVPIGILRLDNDSHFVDAGWVILSRLAIQMESNWIVMHEAVAARAATFIDRK